MYIRDAVPGDAVACAAVYAPYVHDTAITFELEPPSADEMAIRIAAAQRRHAWLVLLDHGQAAGDPERAGGGTGPDGEDTAGDGAAGSHVVGYAYGGEFKSRAAYRWACEVSVYLEPGLRRTGAGRALYEVLLPRLAARGYRTAVAGMTLPNDASLGLHRALGFESVGVFRRVGWKLDAWHDVEFAQRPLLEAPGPPGEPR